MDAKEHQDKMFWGIYMFDSPFVSKYFDEEDTHTFSDSFILENAYEGVRSWLKYATIKKSDYVFGFGKYSGVSVRRVLEFDAQYVEYCLREADRFYLEESFVAEIIDSGYRFSDKTIQVYRQKLADLLGARYIENRWKTLGNRLAQKSQDEFDQQDSDWLNYGQWKNLE